MKIIGIYKIVSLINNKVYVGSSIDIKNRWKVHIYSLNLRRNCSKYFANEWHKYGEENFKFSIIEECTEEELIDKEQYWVDHYQSTIRIKGYNRMEPKEHTRNKEARKNMSDAKKKLYKEKPEIKQKISIALSGENHPGFGKQRSKITKEKISKSSSGINHSQTKLSIKDVEEILFLIKSNEKNKIIIEKFNISFSTLYRIMNKTHWAFKGDDLIG